MSRMIQETKNYDRFELHNINRDVFKIDKLERSMRRYGFLDAHPLHCTPNGNGKLLIKAGHHRFEVAQKLGLPVKYVVCDDGGITIHELEEATNHWSMMDYLRSYARDGREDYIEVEKYHRETGIGLSPCISMLAGETAGSANKNKAFKAGSYKVGDRRHADTVAMIVRACKNAGIKWATNNLFIQALSKMVWIAEFDPYVFMSKVEKYPENMSRQPNLDSYMGMIEDVYNRHAKSRRPLAYLAKEASKQRQLLPTMRMQSA